MLGRLRAATTRKASTPTLTPEDTPPPLPPGTSDHAAQSSPGVADATATPAVAKVPASQSTSTVASQPVAATSNYKKARRKSYGGIRAMLGKPKDDPLPPPPPPVPAIAPVHPAPSTSPIPIWAGGSSSPAAERSRESLVPASPSPTADSRPSTSSLRPFPFLNRRVKSSNQGPVKPTLDPLRLPPSPGFGCSNRPQASRLPFYSSAKVSQSVDDLSQFGLLPPREEAKSPRRSAEFTRPPSARRSTTAPADLHTSLDKIGELAGMLPRVPGPSGNRDDRHPRLSNPKGMRTVYGVPLQDLYWRDGEEYPLLVTVLLDLVEQHGLNQQGIYRIPGEKRLIEELQASIDRKGVKGVDIMASVHKDVHNIAGALKLFLREVPGGVIPFHLYDAFIILSSIEVDEIRTMGLRQLIQDMPQANRVLVKKLVRHFQVVVKHADENSMLAHNLAIVFAPSFLRSGSEISNPLLSLANIGKASTIIRHMINFFDPIFNVTTVTTTSPQSESIHVDESLLGQRSRDRLCGGIDADSCSSSVEDEGSIVTNDTTSSTYMTPLMTTSPAITNKSLNKPIVVGQEEEEVERLSTAFEFDDNLEFSVQAIGTTDNTSSSLPLPPSTSTTSSSSRNGVVVLPRPNFDLSTLIPSHPINFGNNHLEDDCSNSSHKRDSVVTAKAGHW